MAFVIVANLDDLDVGDTMLVDEFREPICLIRLDDDDVRAIHNTCTHQQQPLHEGTLQDDDTLVCAAHASRYDLTTGEAVGVFACGPIPVYACKIEDDAILVRHRPAAERRAHPSSSSTRVVGLALTPGPAGDEDGRASYCVSSWVGTWRSSGTM